MRRSTLPLAISLAALLGLLVAAPASAAVTGTVCGEVTAFTAPAGVVDGSITINGSTEVIDAAATGVATAAATLTLLANADATTCLDIVADTNGDITDIDIAAAATICGSVDVDATTGAHTVDGVLLPTSLVTADGEAQATLDAAATAGADACVDVTVDATTGLIATVGVDATFTVCGEVTLDADGNATIDGAVLDESMLSTDAAALLALAAEADGTACATVQAVSSGGDTTVTVSVTVELCAEVTAMTDDTITVGDVTFTFTGDMDADIEVGDEVCIEAGPGTVLDDGGVLPATGEGGAGALPDTSTDGVPGALVLGTLLVIAAGIGFSAVRRERGGVSL